MAVYDDVLGSAQSLQPAERLQLIDALWDSLPPEQRPAPSEEWVNEVERRSSEYDAGRMSASSWEQVRDRAHKKAGLDE
jgi:putative addiction module component (TIGR02574 family)